MIVNGASQTEQRESSVALGVRLMFAAFGALEQSIADNTELLLHHTCGNVFASRIF